MDFSKRVKEAGSVAAAFEAKGYTKNADGHWEKPKGSTAAVADTGMGDGDSRSGGVNKAAQATPATVQTTASNRNLNEQGYDPNVDYSELIRNETDQAEIERLQQERAQKVKYMYGGEDPYLKNNTAQKHYGSDWTPQTATAENTAAYREVQTQGAGAYQNWLAQQVGAGAMSERDAKIEWAKAGGTVYMPDGTPAWHLSGLGYNTSADLSDAALYGYAEKGDWGSVDEVLKQRKAKAASQGQTYDAIPDWYALNQKYGGPSADLTLEQMYANVANANKEKPASGPAGYGTGDGKVTVTAPTYDPLTPGSLGDYLDQWLAAAQKQQIGAIDHGTNQAILDLVRTEQDAQAQFQQQRNQIDIDEARAKDNQALYSEARGDKGGIGQAQYNSIMNTAAQNRLAVSQAQTKLSTDTSRQITDLRAQGEFEKADALLELTQKYLSELMSLEQWSMEYGLSVAQFNASLQQWQAEFDMAVADLTGYYNGAPTLANQKAQESQLASAGEALLAAGIMPSASQLAAMGLTADQAQGLMTAAQLAAAKKSSGGGKGGGTPTGGGIYQTLFNAGIDSFEDAYAKLIQDGYTDTESENLANMYMDKYDGGNGNVFGVELDDYNIGNQTAPDGSWVIVSGARYSMREFQDALAAGRFVVDKVDYRTKTVTYKKV